MSIKAASEHSFTAPLPGFLPLVSFCSIDWCFYRNEGRKDKRRHGRGGLKEWRNAGRKKEMAHAPFERRGQEIIDRFPWSLCAKESTQTVKEVEGRLTRRWMQPDTRSAAKKRQFVSFLRLLGVAISRPFVSL
mmetsp:Transcript_162/g.383  ORF Transcript_162/g.383 Transcript_162/m.383 type:complete len:133 (+) Transcript_162:519-917(+)